MLLSLLASAAIVTAPRPAMTIDWWSYVYDTPSRGLAPGEASLVVAEIMVNKYGAFAGCTGRAYTGNPQMGPYVCSRLQKRATFEPARGPDGRKIIGVYRKMIVTANVQRDTVRFPVPVFGISIPGSRDGVPTPPFEIQFYLDVAGQASHCSLVETVGINLEREKQNVAPALVAAACAAVPAQLKPVPPRDKKGQPIATVQNGLVIVGGAVETRN